MGFFSLATSVPELRLTGALEPVALRMTTPAKLEELGFFHDRETDEPVTELTFR